MIEARHFCMYLSFTNKRRVKLMRREIDIEIFLNWGYKLESGKCA